jgi:hypothetical protein
MNRAHIKKQGLLAYFIAMNPELSKEIAAPIKTEEQRSEAIHEFSIQHIEQRITSDKELRARVRKTLANLPPEKTGIKKFAGKKDGVSHRTLTNEITYLLVNVHIKRGVSMAGAYKRVADDYGYQSVSVKRKYKKAVASRKVWLLGGKG